MSQLNIRTLLSKSVTAIKEKLGLTSLTWGEYETKLAEAMQGGSTPTETISIYENGDYDVTNYATASVMVEEFLETTASGTNDDYLTIGLAAYAPNFIAIADVKSLIDDIHNHYPYAVTIVARLENQTPFAIYPASNVHSELPMINEKVTIKDGVVTVDGKCAFDVPTYRVIAW